MVKTIIPTSACLAAMVLTAACGKEEYSCSSPEVLEKLKQSEGRDAYGVTEETLASVISGIKIHRIQTISKDFGLKCKAVFDMPSYKLPPGMSHLDSGVANAYSDVLLYRVQLTDDRELVVELVDK